jgi:hypothetical protein
MQIKRTLEESVTIYDPSKAYNGYTLFAPHMSTDLWLIDMKGRAVHRWTMPTVLGSAVRLLPNGNHLRIHKYGDEPTAFLGTGGREIVEVDWEGKVVWKHEEPYMHHDFSRLPNGNMLLNLYIPVPKHIAAKVKGGLAGTELKDGTWWGAGFREITPEGKVVWEWRGYEHMDPEIDVHCPLCRRTIWGYVNGIDVFPNGDIVGSFRYENTLAIIDRKTGAITWRWGRDELGHQHNPTVQKSGNILVLDNGFHRVGPDELDPKHFTPGYSRAVEVNPKTNNIDWQYVAETVQSFYSAVCSSAQRLPNGNTFICESTTGRLFEVTPAGEVVWEFTNPFYVHKPTLGLTNLVFRAYRYGADFPAFKGKDLDPERFEFVLRDTKGSTAEESTEAKKLRTRLGHLGY